MFFVISFDQIVNGNNKSKIVCFAFLQYETTDYFTRLFRKFGEANPQVKNLVTVMLDKSMAEMNALLTVFNWVHIQLCIFHVQQAVLRKLNSLKLNEEERKLLNGRLELLILFFLIIIIILFLILKISNYSFYLFFRIFFRTVVRKDRS